MPAKSGPTDAKLSFKPHGTSAISLTGKGVLVFRPKLASHVAFTGGFGEERIEIDGKAYTRGSLGKWNVGSSKGHLRYGGWADGKDPSVVGEETVSKDKAWHVTATDDDGKFDLWVRESDGYPLRYQSKSLSLLGLEMSFSDFNTGVTVAPPPGLQLAVTPKIARVAVGQAAQLNFFSVTVTEVDSHWTNTNSFEQPRKGSHFVTVRVQYQATGQEKASYNQFDWTLTDPPGSRFIPSFVPRDPPLRSGELEPGRTVKGWIVYEVPDTATGLTLNGSVGVDRVSVGL
jgi:hypothetical protein